MINSPPFMTPFDTNGGKVSPAWQKWMSNVFSLLLRTVDYTGASIQVPVNGFSITGSSLVLTLNPAGVLASGTVIMPANPTDGQPFEVSSTQTITALTVSPSAGQTVKNAPTTLAAGSGFAYYFNTQSATWFRRY